MAKFKVLVGINYPDGSGGEKRAEIGDVVEDLPEKAAKWMERDGIIEPVSRAKSSAPKDEEVEG